MIKGYLPTVSRQVPPIPCMHARPVYPSCTAQVPVFSYPNHPMAEKNRGDSRRLRTEDTEVNVVLDVASCPRKRS